MLSLKADSFENVLHERPSTPHIVRSSLKKGSARIQSAMISAKCVLRGDEQYRTKDWRHVIYPGRFLLATPDMEFDLRVHSKADGCCIFLDPGDLRKLIGQMNSEDLEGGDEGSFDDWTMTLPSAANAFGIKFEAVARRRANGDVQELTAMLAELVGLLSGLNRRLPFKRPAGRRELITRLETARVFLEDAADRSTNLIEVEEAACLSRFHLSRTFALAYGVPPLRFHQNIRLDVAAKQVRAGEPLASIASRLGFSNLSSFSRAYFRRHGRRPSFDRRQISNLGA